MSQSGGYTNITGTTPTNVDSSIPEIWALESLRKVKLQGYWGRFVGGERSGMPIVQKTELQNNPGDLIHVQITDSLSGAGISGDTARLVENEETLTTTELKLATVLYRHGVRINTRAGKKSILNLREEARFRLEEWMAQKIDNLRFQLFLGTDATVLPSPLSGETYTPNAVSFDSAAASGLDSTTVVPDDVDGDDYVSVKGIQALKLKLRAQKAKPIVIDGAEHYVFVSHPNSYFWLKQEARYENWLRDAQVRGDSNPLFSGAIAVIDGMILHDSFNVPTVVNTGTFTVSKGIAFGAEAFAEALDEGVSYAEEMFDYGNQYGMGVRVAFSSRRALEQNSVIAYAAATAV